MTSHSSPSRIYLDFNASAPLASGVAEAVSEALSTVGNPSSPHAEGRLARRQLEKARRQVGAAIAAQALDLVFTSGGTEANHLGLIGLARALKEERGEARVMVPRTVHPSLWEAAQSLAREGIECRRLPVDGEGVLDLAACEQALGAGTPCVVGVSLANHETGVRQDVRALAELVRAKGGWIHCDAVQGLGKVALDVNELGVDSLVLSGHKIGAPKGIGALWLRPGPAVEALVGGGKQEQGRRPGTQALALAAGFGAACDALPERLETVPSQLELLRHLEEGLAALGARRFGSREQRVCNTVCVAFEGIKGELLVSALDLAGIASSTGAACSSGTTSASPGLMSLGIDEEIARGALRLSLGPTSTAAEVEALLEVLPPILERSRRFS